MKSKYTLIYDREARESDKGWEQESLPVGNGYQGANIFGGIKRETLVLSEESLWTGGPVAEGGTAKYKNNDFLGLTNRFGNPIDFRSVEKARQCALKTDNKKITGIFTQEILPGTRQALGCFQSFAVCHMDFLQENKTEKYSRWLCIEDAIAGVEYTCNETVYRRTYFASYPQRVVAAKLTARGKEKLQFLLTVEIPHTENENPKQFEPHFSPENYGKTIQKHQVVNEDAIEIEGFLRQNGLKFAVCAKVVLRNGVCRKKDNGLLISGADEAVIWLSLATDYLNDFSKNYRSGISPLASAVTRVQQAAGQGYAAVKAAHIKDYQQIFNRVSLDLHAGDAPDLTTDRLIRKYPHTKYAKYLEELYFQYGRYLLISSSRVKTLPANLQGVWNTYQFPPWSSDYHLNINLQMNYWPAVRTNMPETVMPLLDYIENLREPGKICAKTLFGLDDAWCFMLASNIFGFVGIGNTWDLNASGFSTWAQTCFAWMCHSLYEIYLYFGDKALLENRIYPLLCACAEFYEKILIYDPQTQRMVISPSYSAEHGGMYAGCTFEQELVWQLFEDYIGASKLLKQENTEAFERICRLQKQLHPLEINKKTGCIKEWPCEDKIKIPQVEKRHRHISHLVGLFPCSHITEKTPEYFFAARKTLRKRGNLGTGWSRANKIGLHARLFNGKMAYKSYRSLLRDCTLPNLWDTHPPFQIDGNFGGTAGVAEMLLQCNENTIKLLPALPKQWGSGRVTGLCAYGGVTVDMEWKDQKIHSAVLRSEKGGSVRVHFGNCTAGVFTDETGEKIRLSEKQNSICIDFSKKKEYRFSL